MAPSATASAPPARARSKLGLIGRLTDNGWVDRLLRVGLAARGVVFIVFGYLVARVALGALGDPSTNKPASLVGVPESLAAQPGGTVVLVALAAGVVLYALFSLLDAVAHHDRESTGKKWGDRALSTLGFLGYLVFGGYVFSVAFSGAHKSAGKDVHQKARWSSAVLRWPAGWLWLLLLGAVLIVIGGFLVARAVRRTFRERIERDRMGVRAWRTTNVLGTIGYLGRAGLFLVVGGCVTSAAVENDPRNGQGIDGSLRIVASDRAGVVLLWLLAAALVAYGAYMFAEARYRRIGPPASSRR